VVLFICTYFVALSTYPAKFRTETVASSDVVAYWAYETSALLGHTMYKVSILAGHQEKIILDMLGYNC
jgi:hypothetical protein